MRFGLDYGGTNLKFGIFSGDGQLISFKSVPLQNFMPAEQLLDNILNFVRVFRQGYDLDRGGVAIKGLVNPQTGMVLEDIGAGNYLAGRNLQKDFETALEIPVIIENDARAYAFGEWLFGAGKGAHTLACMTLGTGLGCAVIHEGRSYVGCDPYGGLLGGHLSIDRNGPECACGNRGCLELYCSAPAFSKRIMQNHPDLIAKEDILPIFFEGVSLQKMGYAETLQTFIDDLAIGVVNVIHAYNPDLVVIGGGVMESADFILPSLHEQVNRRAWTFPRGKVDLRAASLGNKAAALGVAFHPELDNKT